MVLFDIILLSVMIAIPTVRSCNLASADIIVLNMNSGALDDIVEII